MNEELDSQLSAMFDGELPAAECELLARRLSRDEQLKARWGRYAVMGAAIRAEKGVRLNADLARHVSAAIAKEPALLATAAAQRPVRVASGWVRPVAGLGLAAGVAALSILWMRSQSPDQASPGTLVASNGVAAAQPVSRRIPETAAESAPVRQKRSRSGGSLANVALAANAGDSISYVVPKPKSQRTTNIAGTTLASYVVAHSEFSSPVTRRNLLSALMTGESGTGTTSAESDETSEDVKDDGQNSQ
ncbi:MAG TPA: RseA family anti-sigma factor [Steroidobacteraceae bacterium]|jgi:sigma-E factor negative regulatory protein RseA